MGSNFKNILMKKPVIFSILCLTVATFAGQNKKALIIGTNNGTFNNKTNGTYLVEIAAPFQHFLNQGLDVDVVSPLGGKVAIYHDQVTRRMDSISKTDTFLERTSNSLKPEQVDPSVYAIVYIPGGYGQFADVCQNKNIHNLITRAYTAGAVVGAAGHGAASLAYIKFNNDVFFVKGKSMTCFPTWVEKEYMEVSGFGKALPFDMQAELEKNGALLTVSSKENQKINHVVVDSKNRLVTGSFADNAGTVAEELVKMAGVTSK
jgi:putative intracellular protease/amidase